MKRKIYLLTLIILVAGFAASSASAQPFEITKSIISNSGGGIISGGAGDIIQLRGSIGQPVATTTDGSMGGMFNLRSGFFAPAPFNTTAAEVSIRGRVVYGKNRGIGNVFVTITGGAITEPLVARTNQFGYFTFENVEVGYFYIITVSHKRYRFRQNTQSFMLFNNVKGLFFRANGEL